MTSVQIPNPLFGPGSGPILSDSEFAEIAAYAHSAFGLHLLPSKREMVFARLIKRVKNQGAKDFSSYLAFVKRPENEHERNAFLSALTTNVTHFFREPHHFTYLRDSILPPLLDQARAGRRLRIWSAGCSAGQEAFSLAMTLLAICPESANLDIKILASDIDQRILETAEKATYPVQELTAIPEEYKRFTQLIGPQNQDFRISQPVRDLITFAELNLIAEWPMRGPFDIIFCRNVAIYFDAETQSRLWNRFTNLLPLNGHLFIGHSERVSGPALGCLKSVGVTAYVKHTAETSS
jgi:chemotaxis protein methyltransferase CheR